MSTYCEYCGCEILTRQGVGRKERVARPCGIIGERGFVMVYTCQSCVDQEAQDFEDAMAAGDFDVDIMFDEWVKKQAIKSEGNITMEIQPCPFCRSKKVVCEEINRGYYTVVCKRCEAQGPDEPSEELAIDKWNQAKKAQEPDLSAGRGNASLDY